MHDIYQMWYLADQDLLSSYHVLRDTGQGLNRVQKCPSIGRAMTNVISRAQGRLGGGWVGSSVVHLGDHNGTFSHPLFFCCLDFVSSTFDIPPKLDFWSPFTMPFFSIRLFCHLTSFFCFFSSLSVSNSRFASSVFDVRVGRY